MARVRPWTTVMLLRGCPPRTPTTTTTTMPNLHKPKPMPTISLFVPNAGVDGDVDNGGFGSSIFLMENVLKPGSSGGAGTQRSDQFETFIYRKPSVDYGFKSWHRYLLPPPPFAGEIHNCHEITSYAVVGDEPHVERGRQVDAVTLPFHGKVEYVPELKLWFGLSAETKNLAAADHSWWVPGRSLTRRRNGGNARMHSLSTWAPANSASQLRKVLAEQGCAAVDIQFGDEYPNFVVFTGVDMMPHVHDGDGNVEGSGNGGNGELELRITHKSRRVKGADIETLF
ncbi:hypothetical protein ACP70R_005373 [Stipagrostis hirtigluma subsp. patula]